MIITVEQVKDKIKQLMLDGHLIQRTSLNSFMIHKISVYKYGIAYNGFEIVDEQHAQEIEDLLISLRNDFSNLIGMSDYFNLKKE